MAKPLSEKYHLPLGTQAKDLTGADKIKYEQRRDEEARRKDKTAPGVAQEALDHYYELLAENRSPSEVWTTYGYSIEHVLQPALADENRIKMQLAMLPSADVQGGLLDVADVKALYSIPEYVPPVVEEPEPEPIPE
jgi:hypothetical protein